MTALQAEVISYQRCYSLSREAREADRKGGSEMLLLTLEETKLAWMGTKEHAKVAGRQLVRAGVRSSEKPV